MSVTLEDVLARCSETFPFLGKPVISVHQRGLFDDTPLHVVSTWGEPKSVAVLIDAGADLNAKGDRGQTPLFRAVTGRNLDVVRMLLAAGADAKIVDDDGKTVVRYANNVGAIDIAQLLEQSVPHPSPVRSRSKKSR